jgi:hypothetical protein
MMTIMHIRIDRSDWNDAAVEVINSGNFVIQSPWITFVIFGSPVDPYKLDD